MVIVRDRVTALRRLVSAIENHCRVVLIDNASTYPPLLDYLRESETKGHEVVRLGRNLGHRSPWEAGIVGRYPGPFIVTDPDMHPEDSCPTDFVQTLTDALHVLLPRGITKIGMSLRVDDLPASNIASHIRYREDSSSYWREVGMSIRPHDLSANNPIASHVRRCEESSYWREVIGHGSRGEPWYRAHVDTTFALYAAGTPHNTSAAAARIGPPYLMRCPSWYEDPLALSEEERYYVEHANPSSSWASAVRDLQRGVRLAREGQAE